ncbi:Signal transduction histidine kinase [Paenibacillus catalpae]|uniref:histidine kinase n=1 Tax=Paenibacillus catalpae TaxID=1045775 RepID=A0A1I2AL88_9BACL|nr:HAMP domain-containing sensor histidine kinase [Paenibacillus catalpae]SFE44795.1 Signal transduction histidine kinase [Paenibacillus catalpae]
MNTAKTLVMLVIQLCLTAIVLLLTRNTLGGLGWTLAALLIGLNLAMLAGTIRTRQDLMRISNLLRQVAAGNYKTRLLAKQDDRWNEMVFTINKLISRFEKIQIEAAQSHTARQRLLSSISHDIRTPLTSIIGYIDALRDGQWESESESEKQSYLAILSAKSARLKELIDDLFTMAKLDADELPMKEEILDFAEMARETLIEFLPKIEKEEIKLQIELPEVGCFIKADQIAVTRMIQNMIKNAIQYGGEGKVIGVDLLENNGVYELTIWDRGPGISAAELSRIFERSYRADKARGSSGGGSGLGLSIVKALAEKNHGSVHANSKPWDKTEFTIAFQKSIGLRNS